jgi:hypothetical protein
MLAPVFADATIEENSQIKGLRPASFQLLCRALERSQDGPLLPLQGAVPPHWLTQKVRGIAHPELGHLGAHHLDVFTTVRKGSGSECLSAVQ